MSSDARAYKEGVEWVGNHDGACAYPKGHRSMVLEELLQALRECYGGPLYWEFRSNDKGEHWLAAYPYPRED